MKEKSNSNVSFVMLNLQQNVAWRDTLQQFMKERIKIKCNICDVGFEGKGTLKKHVSTVHEGRKQFKCDICNIMFELKENLNRHVAAVHEGNK